MSLLFAMDVHCVHWLMGCVLTCPRSGWLNCNAYQNLIFRFVQLMFVADSFQLTPFSNESRVGLLHVALLVHYFGNFLRHHLRHFFAHVVF